MKGLFLKMNVMFFVFVLTSCQLTKNRTQTKETMKSVNLVLSKKKYQVKVGQELTYQYTCHPSVGLDSDYSIEYPIQPELEEERKMHENLEEEVVVEPAGTYYNSSTGRYMRQPVLIALKEERKVYKIPTKGENFEGGDQATVHLVFKAFNKGSAIMAIHEYYQSKLKKKHLLEIEVIE